MFLSDPPPICYHGGPNCASTKLNMFPFFLLQLEDRKDKELFGSDIPASLVLTAQTRRNVKNLVGTSQCMVVSLILESAILDWNRV